MTKQTKNEEQDNSEVPRHIAIVMDGNGRWAKKRILPRTAGHQAGVKAVQKVLKRCGERGVDVLTLFAFSSENWRRPVEEVHVLMELFVSTLEEQTETLHENGIRLRFIGDKSAFSEKLQQEIANSEEKTKNNSRLTLVIAANYGGRWDILQAAKKIARDVERGTISADSISLESIDSRLSFPDLPEPDLFIRTGGEYRISNFLLWQLAYTELYFTDTLWPDFNEKSLDLAIEAYAGRQRRFGYTSEQIESGYLKQEMAR
ncbi:MAG: isoprenyl transferase [Methylococcaceae bacterium]|nr:isoprenyl transferase [Methylococcaceae bacterium]